jgi:hypothetical protein
MYEKEAVVAAADAVYGAIEAVKDGLGVEDVAAGIQLMTAIAGAVDDFKADTDAAGLHFVARLADLFGDSRVG